MRRSVILASAAAVVAIAVGVLVWVESPETHDVSTADRARAEAAIRKRSRGAVRKIACASSGRVSACSIFVELDHTGRCQNWAVTLAPNRAAQVVRLGSYRC